MKEHLERLPIFNEKFEKYNVIYVTDDSIKFIDEFDEIDDPDKTTIFRDGYPFEYSGYAIFYSESIYIDYINNDGTDIDIPYEYCQYKDTDFIDYTIISKNTKNLKNVFKRFIKIWSGNVHPMLKSYDLYLKYIEKYNYIIHCSDRDTVYKYLTKDEAARIIQKGCHNWLYKPKCKDGTIGIVPRLGYLGKF